MLRRLSKVSMVVILFGAYQFCRWGDQLSGFLEGWEDAYHTSASGRKHLVGSGCLSPLEAHGWSACGWSGARSSWLNVCRHGHVPSCAGAVFSYVDAEL